MATKAKTATKKKPLKFKPPTATAIAKYSDKLKTLADARKVVKLRIAGQSYEDIADEMGISAQDAFNAVKQTVARWQGELTMSATELRDLDVTRLEALMAQVWPYTIKRKERVWRDVEVTLPNGKVMNRRQQIEIDVDPDPTYVKLYISLMERKHKIQGLDSQTLKLEDPKGIRREYVGADINKL